jgi:hypothetical protein
MLLPKLPEYTIQVPTSNFEQLISVTYKCTVINGSHNLFLVVSDLFVAWYLNNLLSIDIENGKYYC